MKKRIMRAIATMTALAGGMVVAAATPALAADEYNYFKTLGFAAADYKITFYGDPYQQVRKHLVIADKKSDGTAPFIRVWPNSNTNPCSIVDYPDRSGNDGVAARYDIYYPVRMIAYVLGDRSGTWGGNYNFSSQSTLVNSLNC